VVAEQGKLTGVECVHEAGGKERARALVHAVRVPTEWRHGLQS
jgi:hypothetical protein